MKKTKIIIPALGLLLLSTAASVTGTVAWFSANSTVTAGEMQVRAKAEKGLLINEVATAGDTHWDEAASANQTSANPSLLFPASTADGTSWYHAASKKSGSAAAASQGAQSTELSGNYQTLTNLVAITGMSNTATAGSAAARNTMGKTASDEAGYYVNYLYYLKSSASAITLGTNPGDQNVRITSVEATLPNEEVSANLNKSVRVGIKLNSEFYIYAPVAGYTSSYYVAAGSTATAPRAHDTITHTDLTSLPASNDNGVTVNVYIWYEGEDANCKTDNATAVTLDNIQIDITFDLVTVPNN